MRGVVTRMGSGKEIHDVVEERVSTIKMACGQTPVKNRVRMVKDDRVQVGAGVTQCPRCAALREGATR